MTTEPTPHDPIPAEPETRTVCRRCRHEWRDHGPHGCEVRVGPPDEEGDIPICPCVAAHSETQTPRASLEAEQAAQIGALREALAAAHTELVEHDCSMHSLLDHCAALLASPAPAVEAYAARLRREGAEAALDVERLAEALDRHWLRLELPLAVCTCGGWRIDATDPDAGALLDPDEPGILPPFSRHVAAALRDAILAATPAGSEGESDGS